MKKRLTALLLTALIVISLIPVPVHAASGAHFTDVPSGHWAYQYVERAYQDRAIVGTGGDPARGTGTFSPDTNMTYGQFLTMLVNAFYREELARVSQEGPWYAPAIRVAVDRGLTFSSQEDLMDLAPYPINRYNMAWILVKILDDKCVVLPSDQERAAAAARIGDWRTVVADQHWEYFVSSIYAMGIITGVDANGTFAGTAPVTRDAAAVIYTRMADKLRAGQNDPKAFQIVFEGDWSMAPAGYKETLEKEFHTVYPRLWARWGSAKVSKHIPVELVAPGAIDNNAAVTTHGFDQARYQAVPSIKISIEDMRNRPNMRTAVFAHELTHASTTAMVRSIDDSVWLVECLADYGLFRYAAWADEQYMCTDCYYQREEEALRTWRYVAYGDSHWFFAYMDERYPTTQTRRGLLDSILLAIQDDSVPTDGGTAQNDAALNTLVREITGYGSLEALRRRYVQELDAGTWTFDGFAGYADNYITEGLPGVPDPTYPTGADFNFCNGAYTYGVSGQASEALAANNLVDGDLSTRWEADRDDVTDSNLSWDTQHTAVVALGRPVTFDTYTLYHEGSRGDSSENTKAWRAQYYDERTEKWVQFDEVRGNTQDVTTRTFAPVTSQYIWIEILDPSGTGDGTVRLYELEVFRKG